MGVFMPHQNVGFFGIQIGPVYIDFGVRDIRRLFVSFKGKQFSILLPSLRVRKWK